MKKPTTQSAVLLSIATVMFSQLPMAALTAAEETRLSSYEQQVFGKTRPNLSEETRLRALENNLFGHTQSGETQGRLNSISKLVGKSTPLTQKGFAPPQAATLDRAEFAPAPTASPDAVSPSAVASDDDEPAPASTNDQAKELLRTALAKHAGGNVSEAERIFKQVLNIDPKNADANFSLGTIGEQRGDLNGALRYYKAASVANPSDYEIQDALKAVQSKLQQQQVAQQQAQQQQQDAQRKNEMRGLARQAATAYKSGDFDSAISKLNRVAAAEPKDANAQFALAQAWRGKGDYNRAQGYLNAALALDPGNSLYQSTMRDMQQEGQQSAQQQMAQNDPRPQGEITPFAPDTSAPRGGGPRNGLAGLFGGGGSNDDSLDSLDSGPGSSPSYGWSPAGGGGGIAYSSSGRSRLGSAVAGTVMGAALGAFTGRGIPGGVKRGMLQGALMGGMMGLLRN